MKTTVSLLFFVCSITCSFAQVQRTPPASRVADSASVTATTSTANTRSKKAMMKELNLTKEQKSKLKEIKQANKAKMEAVMNDTQLSAAEKKARLKSLHTQQLKNTLAILNDEQKARMKQMRQQKQQGGKMEMEEQ